MPNVKLDYPLEQVLEIKKKRVQDAEKKLKEAQEALAREKEILKQKEKARDKVLKHRNDKLAQMRAEMDLVDVTTTSNKIQQMKDYLKVVDKKLVEEEKKVEEQKRQVEAAEQQVEQAKEELRLRRLEVDKLDAHKDDWLAMMREELQRQEDLELDEIGSIMYLKHLRESKSGH
jgi:chromosome segregation ATPase